MVGYARGLSAQHIDRNRSVNHAMQYMMYFIQYLLYPFTSMNNKYLDFGRFLLKQSKQIEDVSNSSKFLSIYAVFVISEDSIFQDFFV